MLSLFAPSLSSTSPTWFNLTVYHVNPHSYGAIPLDMDTADEAGDIFFDMNDVLILPLSCPNGAASGHGCTNQEAVSPDLVVNKLTLQVKGFDDTGYAMCNIGIVSPVGSKPPPGATTL